jgi:hypothetical protein
MDGSPLVVSVNPATPFRFIMLRLPSAGFLHLDEVEVYGHLEQFSRQPEETLMSSQVHATPVPIGLDGPHEHSEPATLKFGDVNEKPLVDAMEFLRKDSGRILLSNRDQRSARVSLLRRLIRRS